MFKKSIIFVILFCFLVNTLGLRPAHADSVIASEAKQFNILNLPEPGAMVNLSSTYAPVLMKGLRVHPENPFKFDFIMDTGNDPQLSSPNAKDVSFPNASVGNPQQEHLKLESNRLIKYFLTALTVPEKDLWVNLSPYEKDRLTSQNLGQTQMGSDLLAQDYMLKQLTASLIYPEKELGKVFWDKVYAKAQQMYGTTQVPVNTFNKVWIVAERADVFERNNTAYITGAHLKVMLEEDYTALNKGTAANFASGGILPQKLGTVPITTIASNIVREIILPEIEREVNEGKNFAPLRQMFYSMILASWYKMALKDALLTQVYGNQSKLGSLGSHPEGNSPKDLEKNNIELIYQRYLEAYKKGVFNYIKETNTPTEMTPRKYFSGGFDYAMLGPGPATVLNRTTAIPTPGALRPTGSLAMVSGAAATARAVEFEHYSYSTDGQRAPRGASHFMGLEEFIEHWHHALASISKSQPGFNLDESRVKHGVIIGAGYRPSEIHEFLLLFPRMEALDLIDVDRETLDLQEGFVRDIAGEEEIALTKVGMHHGNIINLTEGTIQGADFVFASQVLTRKSSNRDHFVQSVENIWQMLNTNGVLAIVTIGRPLEEWLKEIKGFKIYAKTEGLGNYYFCVKDADPNYKPAGIVTLSSGAILASQIAIAVGAGTLAGEALSHDWAMASSVPNVTSSKQLSAMKKDISRGKYSTEELREVISVLRTYERSLPIDSALHEEAENLLLKVQGQVAIAVGDFNHFSLRVPKGVKRKSQAMLSSLDLELIGNLKLNPSAIEALKSIAVQLQIPPQQILRVTQALIGQTVDATHLLNVFSTGNHEIAAGFKDKEAEKFLYAASIKGKNPAKAGHIKLYVPQADIGFNVTASVWLNRMDYLIRKSGVSDREKFKIFFQGENIQLHHMGVFTEPLYVREGSLRLDLKNFLNTAKAIVYQGNKQVVVAVGQDVRMKGQKEILLNGSSLGFFPETAQVGITVNEIFINGIDNKSSMQFLDLTQEKVQSSIWTPRYEGKLGDMPKLRSSLLAYSAALEKRNFIAARKAAAEYITVGLQHERLSEEQAKDALSKASDFIKLSPDEKADEIRVNTLLYQVLEKTNLIGQNYFSIPGVRNYVVKFYGVGGNLSQDDLIRTLSTDPEVLFDDDVALQKIIVGLGIDLQFSQGLLYHGTTDLDVVLENGKFTEMPLTRVGQNYAAQAFTQENLNPAIVLVDARQFNSLRDKSKARLEHMHVDIHPSIEAGLAFDEVLKIIVSEDTWEEYQTLVSQSPNLRKSKAIKHLIAAGKLDFIKGFRHRSNTEQGYSPTARNAVLRYMVDHDLFKEIPLLELRPYQDKNQSDGAIIKNQGNQYVFSRVAIKGAPGTVVRNTEIVAKDGTRFRFEWFDSQSAYLKQVQLGGNSLELDRQGKIMRFSQEGVGTSIYEYGRDGIPLRIRNEQTGRIEAYLDGQGKLVYPSQARQNDQAMIAQYSKSKLYEARLHEEVSNLSLIDLPRVGRIVDAIDGILEEPLTYGIKGSMITIDSIKDLRVVVEYIKEQDRVRVEFSFANGGEAYIPSVLSAIQGALPELRSAFERVETPDRLRQIRSKYINDLNNSDALIFGEDSVISFDRENPFDFFIYFDTRFLSFIQQGFIRKMPLSKILLSKELVQLLEREESLKPDGLEVDFDNLVRMADLLLLNKVDEVAYLNAVTIVAEKLHQLSTRKEKEMRFKDIVNAVEEQAHDTGLAIERRELERVVNRVLNVIYQVRGFNFEKVWVYGLGGVTSEFSTAAAMTAAALASHLDGVVVRDFEKKGRKWQMVVNGRGRWNVRVEKDGRQEFAIRVDTDLPKDQPLEELVTEVIGELKQLTIITAVDVSRVIKDQVSSKRRPGGIDLDKNKMQMSVSREGQQDVSPSINIDPAMLQRFKKGDFAGLEFHIETIIPITNLPLLLGLRKEEESVV